MVYSCPLTTRISYLSNLMPNNDAPNFSLEEKRFVILWICLYNKTILLVQLSTSVTVLDTSIYMLFT